MGRALRKHAIAAIEKSPVCGFAMADTTRPHGWNGATARRRPAGFLWKRTFQRQKSKWTSSGTTAASRCSPNTSKSISPARFGKSGGPIRKTRTAQRWVAGLHKSVKCMGTCSQNTGAHSARRNPIGLIPPMIHHRITMKTATVRDLRNNFAEVSKWIEHGEQVSITRDGAAFATLAPAAVPKPAKVDWKARLAKRPPVGKGMSEEAREKLWSDLRD
jgi:antitoxin (DNA-binding transcriptional repressor) of toxin-antitoxin stability system